MNTMDTGNLLDHVPVGGRVRLVGIDLDPAESQRLMEMGLIRGTEIQVRRRAPLGYPVEIEARGSRLSLRRDVVRSLRVETIQRAG